MAENTITDSLLAILRSQERRQETETAQSLQAMSLALESDRAERRLAMEERIAFDQKTEKLSARIEAKKKDYLNTIYTNYFQSDFLSAFKNYMEDGKLKKEAALDSGKDGYDGLRKKYLSYGFSEEDADKIVSNLYSYVADGKTSSTNIQEIVDMFISKSAQRDTGRVDKNGNPIKEFINPAFVAAAVKGGIWDTSSEENFQGDMQNFKRSGQYDIAALGLIAETIQSNEGDLDYDFDYETFISGGKLERVKGVEQSFETLDRKKKEATDLGVNYYTDKNWANKIEGVEYSEEDVAIGKSGYRIKDADYEHHEYDPLNVDVIGEWENIGENVVYGQEKLLSVEDELGRLEREIAIKNQNAHLTPYTENDKILDSTKLIELQKQKQIYSSYIEDNQKVLDTLDEEYSIASGLLQKKLATEQQLTIPDVEVDKSKGRGLIKTPSYIAKD